MPTATRTFQVFVSSSFADLNAARDALLIYRPIDFWRAFRCLTRCRELMNP